MPAKRTFTGAHGRPRPTLLEVFRTALWLGALGFGGGYSVLSSLRAHVVERRGWLTEREFANTAAISQMLPGGAASNAIAYVGLRFRGPAGAIVGYAGFVLPGFLCVLGLAAAYVRYGAAPRAELVLGGFNAAVVGIIAALTVEMVRSGIGRFWQMGVAVAALLLSLPGGSSAGEIAVLGIAAGLVADLGQKRARLARYRAHHRLAPAALPETGELLAPPRPHDPARQLPAFAVGLTFFALHETGLDSDVVRLVLVFFRTGLGAYGGGFAVIPHLKGVVESQGWLTDHQFSDAVAIAKITPGPILLLATFIGYLVHGTSGALVATVAVFAAPLALLVTLGTFLDRVRSRRPVRAALRGLTPAVAGLMAGAALSLGGSLGPVEAGIAAAVGLTMNRFPVNPAYMLLAGGVTRLVLKTGFGI